MIILNSTVVHVLQARAPQELASWRTPCCMSAAWSCMSAAWSCQSCLHGYSVGQRVGTTAHTRPVGASIPTCFSCTSGEPTGKPPPSCSRTFGDSTLAPDRHTPASLRVSSVCTACPRWADLTGLSSLTTGWENLLTSSLLLSTARCRRRGAKTARRRGICDERRRGRGRGRGQGRAPHATPTAHHAPPQKMRTAAWGGTHSSGNGRKGERRSISRRASAKTSSWAGMAARAGRRRWA